MTRDIVVCGLGPAGRALAHRCLTRGLSVTVVDPAPERRWTATYAVWADELPDWVDRSAVAATVVEPIAYGHRQHALPRTYAVLNTGRLQDSLDLTGATVVTGRAKTIGRREVELASGSVLRADRVIDARGLGRTPGRAEQTAYGLVLDAQDLAQSALFMDWRLDNGAPADAPRSFLYAIPLGGEAMLFEETCLAGRPALELGELEQRLHHRLRARGVGCTGRERVERVRFPVTGGRPGADRFGAAGALTHPATGYSVAAALAAADTVATGGTAWPPSARAVHRLRLAGLRALLSLPPADLPDFFDAFFAIPPDLQRAYLSGRTDPAGTAAAMSRIFADLPAPIRRRVAAATLRLPTGLRTRIGSAMME
ncbi:lycopene cyclase family protein [Nocardia donostiensis]|uniref:Lycopene cyclase n=1 Tax=Nocardia donostiensis TaxID=1538463 RepID=A0A1W0AZ91_9NOCA|nr:lycopene cyclase family protein [Nocardia donostiensis]ONM48862.1 lycopene cyclase [Nocardia donostiensis]OQS15516.1 lycopene cyclase [Nocardia donostiensis]OQS22882.1 lycopene cyclase [Nocardia donostiensis]